MNQSESIAKLTAALVKARAAMSHPPKSASNPFFKSKYADLMSVTEACVPALLENGLSLMQFPDGHGLTTILSHESGEWISATMELQMPKPDPQAQGSAITYARRYAICSVLGLVGDPDDDANAATPQRDKSGKMDAKESERIASQYIDQVESKDSVDGLNQWAKLMAKSVSALLPNDANLVKERVAARRKELSE